MLQHSLGIAIVRPSDLKLNNRIQILELFKSGAVYSVADIAREIGISRQTVMKAIQFFLEKGVIESEGKAASRSMGGKRAELFSLSANRYLINVLICPDCLYISLFNFRCEVIDSFKELGIANMGVDAIMDIAGKACLELMRSHDIQSEDVYGVCVSTPGTVQSGTNILRYNTLFPAWGMDIPLAEKLTPYFGDGMLIMAENVSKVCGSAFLHAPGCMNMRGVTVFSCWGGISASLMACGHIISGKDSLIGEIGHMMLVPEDREACSCGGHGCFERQVSGERIRQFIEEHISAYPDSMLGLKPIGEIAIRDVFEASRMGDALGRLVSGYAARFFAQAMHNLTLIFNPDWVVFQGDYAEADEHFREVLYGELGRYKYYQNAGEDSPFPLRMDTRSITDLTTLGAYTLLIDRLFSDETTYS